MISMNCLLNIRVFLNISWSEESLKESETLLLRVRFFPLYIYVISKTIYSIAYRPINTCEVLIY